MIGLKWLIFALFKRFIGSSAPARRAVFVHKIAAFTLRELHDFPVNDLVKFNAKLPVIHQFHYAKAMHPLVDAVGIFSV